MQRIPPNALRWSPAASEMIHGLLQAQQFPDSCAATKWLVVEMDQAGDCNLSSTFSNKTYSYTDW